MKRPLFLLGTTFLISTLTALYLLDFWIYTLAGAFFALFVASVIIKACRRAKTLPVVFITISLSLISVAICNHFKIKPVEVLNEKEATIAATICETPYKEYGKYYYILQTESIKMTGEEDVAIPQKVKIRMSISSKPLSCDVYDKVSGKVKFFSGQNEKGLGSTSSLRAKGILATCYLYEFEEYQELPGDQKPIYYYVLKAKQVLNEKVRRLLPQNLSPLASGLLFGDRYDIDLKTTTNFRKIGLSHLLAVSGLQVVIISQSLMMLFGFLKLNRRRSAVFAILGVLLFMALTGFSSSVARAGVMNIIMLFGVIIMKKPDTLNSLGASVLLLNIFNPLAAGDIGLLLSFSSTLGIILFCEKLQEFLIFKTNKLIKSEKISKLAEKVMPGLALTICATAFTLPITMLLFKSISLITVLSNLLLVLPSNIALVLMLLAVVIDFISFAGFITNFLALISAFIIKFMLWVSDLLASLSFSSVSTSQGYILFFLAGTGLLFALSILLTKRGQTKNNLFRLSAFLSSILLLVGIVTFDIFNKDVTTLSAVDCGDGCTIVLTKGKQAVMLSCGGEDFKSNSVNQFLSSKNVDKLDLLLLSDFKDHTSMFAKNVIKEYVPGKIVYVDLDSSDSRLNRAISDSKESVKFANKMSADLFANPKVTTVYEGEQSFIYLTINDVDVLIMPSGGDANLIPEDYRNPAFLILGKIPENLGVIKTVYSINCCKDEFAKNVMKVMVESGVVPFATGGAGNIEIDFFKKNEFAVRRTVL